MNTQEVAVKRWPWVVALSVVLIGSVIVLREIMMPFAIGALLAYLGDPLVDRLEERGMSRTGGVIAVFVLLLLVIMIAVAVVVPAVLQQLIQFIQQIPVAYAWLAETALPWVQRLLSISPIQLPPIDVQGELAQRWQSVGAMGANVLRYLTASGANLVLSIVNLALVPVVAFYLMRDWDHIVARLVDLVPRPWQQQLSLIVGEADSVLGEFLRGQLLVMLTLAVVYSLGLWLLDVQYAVLLGSLAGMASMVPYVGAIVGIGASLIVAGVQFDADLTVLALVAGVFAIGQLLESFVLTPWLIGDRIGLHPVAVIFALLAGGELAGFTGVLLALPIAAIAVVFFRHGLNHYRASDLYHRE
jgi:predicted PurR-regulated permease PerM